MPRTSHSLATELSRQWQLNLSNGQYDRLAEALEAAEDRDALLKAMRMDKQLVIETANAPKE